MQSFALYDSLFKLVDEKNEFDLQSICNKISKFDETQCGIIAALIHHHWLLEGNKIKAKHIPYTGKYITENKQGVIMELKSLPNVLQKIICLYATTIK